MILPTKHEDLKQNLLVVGSEIIKAVRHESENLEEVFQLLKKNRIDASLEKFHDALTLLWLLNFIELENGIIKIIRSQNVSEKDLF
jgi:hypothetical protein